MLDGEIMAVAVVVLRQQHIVLAVAAVPLVVVAMQMVVTLVVAEMELNILR
tara:strand:- start:170 stop:322 length:153 start_codon:yes stop_codon:yes gene_type:complete